MAKLIVGQNDLASQNPLLASEWNYSRNEGKKPEAFAVNSNKKAWWICSLGHEWESKINNRNNGNGCPYCAGKRPIVGETDLCSLRPEIAEEWNYIKNAGIAPQDFTCGSTRRVWWKCQFGHEWKTAIENRVNGTGCPICKRYLRTSFPEQAIYYYIRKKYPKTVNGYKDIFDNKMELDIFIPELRVGIEYDGKIWHSGEKSDKKEKEKYEYCRSNHIYLIRIREDGNNSKYCDHAIVSTYRNKNDFISIHEMMEKIKEIVPLDCEIDIDRDAVSIRRNYYSNLEQQSLLIKNPELAEEWNYRRNKGILPNMLTPNSGEKVWWVCSRGHEWQNTVANRNRGNNCPYCAGKKILSGYNDLQALNPNLAIEWNYEKNKGISENNISPNTQKKVWWRCKEGHEWRATVASRNRGNGCPVCAGKTIIKGLNDLQTLNPELASEWNNEKNGLLTATLVGVGSGKKVWWKCRYGHEWEAVISSRTRGNGCPFCSGRNVIIGKNDLQTVHPEIAAEWNYNRNGKMLPTQVSYASGMKAWWICSKNHEWQATVASRMRCGCPICSNKKLLSGFNDIETVFPELMNEWNVEKNVGIDPKSILCSSRKSFWWICNNGHEWKTTVWERKNGKVCPYCSNKKVLKGFNDLATVNPQVSLEWNYNRNEDLTPEDVLFTADRSVWWICNKRHEWQARIYSRNQGHKCPYCTNKKVLVGYNDLLTVRPLAAAAWNYEKNNGLQPSEVVYGSSKKCWWKCPECDETFEKRIDQLRNCPKCKTRFV